MGLSTDWLGSYIVAQTAGASVAALLWARLAERSGARLVITVSAAVLLLIPLLALAGEYVGGGLLLLLAFALGGAANGGSRAGFWQYILDLVPARGRRMFMGLATPSMRHRW